MGLRRLREAGRASTRTSLLQAAAAGLALSLTAVPGANAHPHVFIDNAVALAFSGGKLEAVRLEWTFDEVFSADVIGDYDTDQDGKFSAAELPALQKGAFANLADYHHYLVYLWVGGQLVDPVQPREFSARIEDGKLVYRFTVALPAAIDPRETAVKLEVYDEEYYIEVLLAEEHPVTIEGDPGGGCRPVVGEDESRPFYFDMVLPQQVTLQCPAS